MLEHWLGEPGASAPGDILVRAIGYEWDENDNLTAIGDADSYYEFTFDALR